MKKIIILAIIVVLMIINYSVGRKYFKEYGGIETWQWGNKLTVKTDSSEWTVKILPKKLNLEQEFALEMWREILNTRFPKKDGEHIERIKAEEYIQLLVEVLAARIKTGEQNFKDILVSNKDIKKALSLLNETSPIIADMFVGNWNGYCSVSELNKFINYPKTAPQVGVVRKMIISYSYF